MSIGARHLRPAVVARSMQQQGGGRLCPAPSAAPQAEVPAARAVQLRPLRTPASSHVTMHQNPLLRTSVMAGGGQAGVVALQLSTFHSADSVSQETSPPHPLSASSPSGNSWDALPSDGDDPLHAWALWRQVCRSRKWQLVKGVLALVLATACNLANPVLVAGLMDTLLNANSAGARVFLAIFGSAAAVQWTAHRIYQQVWLTIGGELLKEILDTANRVILYRHSVVSAPTAHTASEVAKEYMFQQALLKASCATPDAGPRAVLKFIGAIPLMFVATPQLAPLVVPLFGAAITFIVIRQPGTASAEKQASLSAEKRDNFMSDELQSSRHTRSSCTEEQAHVKAKCLAEAARVEQERVNHRVADTQLVAACLVTTAWIIILLRGIQLYSTGSITFFVLQAALSCAFELTSSMAGTFNAINYWMSAAAAHRRMVTAATKCTKDVTDQVVPIMQQAKSSVADAVASATQNNNVLRFGDLVVCQSGTVTTLSGPSGSGKSMLLDQFAGVQPQSHRMKADGPEDAAVFTLNGKPVNTTDAEYRIIVAYCPQSATNNLPPGTVEAIIARCVPGGVSPDIVKEAMELANLDEVDPKALCGHLSGGQQQRVAHARAYARCIHGGVHCAKFLLLDEPTSALDDDRTRRFWASVEKMTNRGVGVLAVTHDPHEVARYYRGERHLVFMNAQGAISDAPHDISLRTAQRATPVAR